MGMFDTIKCEYKLPVPANLDWIDFNLIQDKEFQTKDMDCVLNEYTITQDGRLMLKKAEYKWVDDDNSFLKGYLDEVSSVLEDTNFHGQLNFYCFEYIEKDNKELSICIDYLAKFTDGKLVNISVLDSGIQDTTSRKENIDKLFEEDKRIKNLWYNKYFLRTKCAITLKRWLYRQIVNIQKHINNCFYLILRYL